LPEGIESTASLKLMLEGIQEVLSALKELEDQLDRIKQKGGSINLGGGPSNSAISASASGNMGKASTSPSSATSLFNPPSAVGGTAAAPISSDGILTTADMASFLGAPPAIASATIGAPVVADTGSVGHPGTNVYAGKMITIYPGGAQWSGDIVRYGNNDIVRYGGGLSTGNASIPFSNGFTQEFMNNAIVRYGGGAQMYGGAGGGAGVPSMSWNPGPGGGGGSIVPYGMGPNYGNVSSGWEPGEQGIVRAGSGLQGAYSAGRQYRRSDFWDTSIPGVQDADWWDIQKPEKKKPGDGKDAFRSRIGLYMAIRTGVQALEDQAAIESQTIAGGRPWSNESMLPSEIELGAIGIGAIAGAGFGQPEIGAAIGAITGKISSTALHPYIERDIAQKFLQKQYTAMNGGVVPILPNNQIDFAQAMINRGTPIPTEWESNLQSMVIPQTTGQAAIGLGAKFGTAIGGAVIGGTAGAIPGAMVGGTVGAGIGISIGAIGGAIAGWQAADAIWTSNALKNRREGIFREDASKEQIGNFAGMAMSPFVERQIGAYYNNKLSRSYADQVIMTGGADNPQAAISALAGMEQHDFITTALGRWLPQLRHEQDQARYSSDIANSKLPYDIALAKTKSAADVRAAYTGQDALEYYNSQRELASTYMPGSLGRARAEGAMKQFVLQGRMDIFQAESGETSAYMELGQSEYLGAAQFAAASGSVANSGVYGMAQAKAAREKATFARSLADNKRNPLSDEQRMRLRASANDLDAEANVSQYDAIVSNVKGEYAIAMTGVAERSVAPTTALMYGYGGRTAGAAYADIARGGRESVAAAQRMVDAFSNEPNSRASIEARNTLVSARLQSARMEIDRANVPMGGYESAKLYGLRAEESALKSGLIPGAPGMIRNNLQQQMGTIRSHISDIDAEYAELAKEHNGRPLPEQAKRLAAQRASAVEELSGLTREFNFGYMDRLMSIAANVPHANEWIARAAFSNREASQSGILHPSIGGTKAQIHQMQALGYDLRNLANADPQGGSAAGYTRQAQGAAASGSTMPIQIEVTLKDDRGNTLSKNSKTIENFKNAQDVRWRPGLSNRVYS